MNRLPSGTVAWSQDPTGAHNDRPVIVLSHDSHPFGASDCAVMCAGTGANKHNHPTPELKPKHLRGISFSKPTYLMPWALYTIPPSVINTGRAMGNLTSDGERLVKKALISLL